MEKLRSRCHVASRKPLSSVRFFGTLILQLQLPLGSRFIGFADDTLVLSSGKTIPELETTANETLSLVSDEIRNLGLLAVHKTEVVVLASKYKFVTPRLLLDGQTIQQKDKMKYLGMIVERGLLFKDHIAEAASKAEKMANVIGRLMSNIGSPKNPEGNCSCQSPHQYSSTEHRPGRRQCPWSRETNL